MSIFELWGEFMQIKQNAFGDYLIYKGCINKGYTLKILGICKVYDKSGLIGYILERNGEYISYDVKGNTIKIGAFEEVLLHFFA